MTIRAILAFLAATAALGDSAAQAADIAHGETLAQRWCATCHLIDTKQQPAAIGEAAPFATVAQRPDFDMNRLAFFLLDPHPRMPNMSLSRSEAADLAAYIASLRR